MTEIWDPQIADNPYNFVMFAFPWGKAGTPLAAVKGPRSWQRDELQAMAEHITENKKRIIRKQEPLVYRSSTVSGRGVGKSGLVSMINLWFMSTVLGGTSIITANTEDQLKSKTWAELGKWHTLMINSHWFERMALSLKPAAWFEDALKKQLKIDTGYYYSSAQLWSEDNPDAFAGTHNYNGTLTVFDEASGIPAPIFTVTEGFFTEPVLHRYWFCFGNGRRNTGPFFETFHKHRKRWRNRNLDSRTVEGTDKAVLNEIVQAHGEESDEARVEVKGQFPKQGDRQFISRSIVEEAVNREIDDDKWAPLYMGVDVARFGDDSTVIRFRQGRNGKVIAPIVVKSMDNMEVADICAEAINKYNPDAVCVDAGNGTGVIDRLKQLNFKVHEVWFGSKSPEKQWANNRTFLWAEMREWLKGAAIDAHPELETDLTAPEYKFMAQSDIMRLETKEELKARGFASPDHADALACTFAVKVARKDRTASRTAQSRVRKYIAGSNFGD